jgi:hypothetical protein
MRPGQPAADPYGRESVRRRGGPAECGAESESLRLVTGAVTVPAVPVLPGGPGTSAPQGVRHDARLFKLRFISKS